MKVDVKDGSIFLQAGNKKEEEDILNLFSTAAQKVPGGPGAFNTQAIFVLHRDYSGSGKHSFSISFDI